MKKKRIITIIIIVVLFIGSVVSIISYNNYQKEQTRLAIEKGIEKSIDTIDEQRISFEESEREQKLLIYHAFVDNYDAYINSENTQKEVVDKYESVLTVMKKYFINDYNNFINENTLTDVGIMSDDEMLRDAVSSLTKELELIKSDDVCTGNEYETYETKINCEIERYKIQIAVIETAEEQARLEAEEQARLEAEKLAAEKTDKKEETDSFVQNEKDKVQQTNKPANDKGNDSNTNNSNNGSSKENPNRKKYSSYEEVERLINEGVITEYYYYEQEGGYKYYRVWHYNYCNDGEIIDLSSDPVFGW